MSENEAVRRRLLHLRVIRLSCVAPRVTCVQHVKLGRACNGARQQAVLLLLRILSVSFRKVPSQTYFLFFFSLFLCIKRILTPGLSAFVFLTTNWFQQRRMFQTDNIVVLLLTRNRLHQSHMRYLSPFQTSIPINNGGFLRSLRVIICVL